MTNTNSVVNDPFAGEAAVGRGSGEGFELQPDGMQPAVLVAIIDLGTQENTFQGVAKAPSRRLFLVWEMTDAPLAGTPGRNHTIGMDFSIGTEGHKFIYFEKSKLRQFLEMWRGAMYKPEETISVVKCLGQPCVLTIMHKDAKSGNKYAVIKGISRPGRTMTVPPATIKTLLWVVTGKEPIPEGSWIPFVSGTPLREVIARSPEWQERLRLEATSPRQPLAGKPNNTTFGPTGADPAPAAPVESGPPDDAIPF